MSDTKNVKLGVCRVYYGGVDLGYTQGGVEVTVTTDTHKVNVDQFGKTTVNEIIMARNVDVKVPLAETTLDNMIRIMPGASLIETGGTKASATVTFSAVAVAGDQVVVNGVPFNCVALPELTTDFGIGADVNHQAQLFAAAVNATFDPNLQFDTSVALGVVTLTSRIYGTAGNVYTLAKTGATTTLSGATFTGGVAPTKSKVSVPTGIGISLLDIAKPLVLHPQANADTDLSDDFTIPIASTPGALQYAYDVEKERIFNVSFTGYPDPVTSELFIAGH